MRKRTSKPVKLTARRRHSGRAWMWAAAMALTGSVIAALTTTPWKPSAGDAAPAASFLPTVETRRPSPGPAPDGMVWIPGGEFSMGAQFPPDMHDAVGMQATTDSRPAHRVSVDG